MMFVEALVSPARYCALIVPAVGGLPDGVGVGVGVAEGVGAGVMDAVGVGVGVMVGVAVGVWVGVWVGGGEPPPIGGTGTEPGVAALVVAATAALGAERFPCASIALTVKLWVVPVRSSMPVADVAEVTPTTFAPSETEYCVTPTLSVSGAQRREAVSPVVPVTARPAGAAGG